jgi:Flp pilus assembly protein TadD
VNDQPEIDAQRALDAARQAVELDPELGWAQMSLGIALNIAGDHDGALTAARRVAEMSGDDPYVLTFSALIQTFEGQVDTAVPLARQALRLDPLSVRTPFRNILGAILFQAGRYQESIEVLQENLELGGPDGPHAAY